MNIKPSAEVRNNYAEISKLCKETKEPVYVTVNGKGDCAIIDIDVLEELYARIELYKELSVGIKQIKEGKKTSHEEVFAQFKR